MRTTRRSVPPRPPRTDTPDEAAPGTPPDIPRMLFLNPAQEANKSSWLINVGTHKKPADEQEFHILRASLSESIKRVLARDDFATKCYYAVVKPAGGGAVTAYTDPVYRTQNWLKILSQKASFVVEIGSTQGRVDAHIMITVTHRSRLQFDHNAFQRLLDDELESENDMFALREIPNKNPRRAAAGPWLRWAEPNLYVSFRTIGKINLLDAHRYMNKVFKTPAYPDDERAFYSLAQARGAEDEVSRGNRGRLVPVRTPGVTSTEMADV